jgi:hypothetical protein
MRKKTGSKALKVAMKATELAATVATPTPLGLGAGALQVIDLVSGMVEEVRRRKVQELLQEAMLANAPDAGAAALLRAHLQDEKFQRVLVEAVRAKLEALADEVTPALAMLMREYERTGQAPDWFFRSVCRALQDLSGEEYAELASFITRLVRALANDTEAAWVVVAADEKRVQLEVLIPIGEFQTGSQTLTWMKAEQHTLRLLRLLGASGLGMTTQQEELRWRVEQAVLRRLHGLLTPHPR